jgi:hypothetical protein
VSVSRWRAIALALAILAVVSCSGGDDTPSGAEDSAPTSTTTDLSVIPVTLTTTSGAVAANLDDLQCDWGEARYEIADGEGTTIGAGTLRQFGSVVSTLPNYRCDLSDEVAVAGTDFYEVTFSGTPVLGDPWEVTETFSRAEAEAGLMVAVS